MGYKYEEQKPNLFTEDGVKLLLKMRDKTKRLLQQAGAFQAENAFETGDCWTMLAVLDYMVEQGEIREITGHDTPGQYRIFVGA